MKNSVKKGYLVEPDGGHYSYRIFEDLYGYAQKIKLFYSKIGVWTAPYKGKKFLTAEMDGNFNTTFTFDDGKVVTLDISQLNAIHEVAKLMDTCNKQSMCKYRNVKI